VGGEWNDEQDSEKSSIVDESGWEDYDAALSDGSSVTKSDMELLTGGNEQADTTLGDCLSTDNVPQVSADDNASEHANEVLGEEPKVADIDDAGLQTSRISLRRRRTPAEIHEDPFCSECELIIHTDHLLKCNEPSCTEKVCFSNTMKYQCPLMYSIYIVSSGVPRTR
jgi:hypothetical protein